MKIAVINFSGNVGKTTIARHLLLPRIPGAESISVESINASEGDSMAMRGKQFGALQDYLHTIESAVVDIGASNVDELIHLMRVYRGSHADYDYFIVPTTPAIKQQQDTIATLVDLSQLGVPPARIKLVFNMAEFGTSVDESFFLITAFLKDQAICTADPSCCLGANDIYGRLRRMTDAAKAHVIKHIAQQADKATRQSIDLHLRAMDDAAQALFKGNVGPAIQRLTQPLQRLYEVVKETSNPWNSWLTHVGSAILAAMLTWLLLSGALRP